MSPKVEKVIDNSDGGVLLGEAPHWDAERQSLYFVDIFSQSIHKYVPSTGKHTKAPIGKHVSTIIPVKGKINEFVITTERKIVKIKWDGESEDVSVLETLYEVDQDKKNNFNDGKCDPTGRLWAGTLPTMDAESIDSVPNEQGSLYSFQNGKATKRLSKVGLSNGLAFDVDRKKFYYVDTLKGTLDQYDFDVTNGELSNGRPLYTFKKPGFSGSGLDGLTIDTDGNVYVAVFNGYKVLKLDTTKPETILETIEIPAKEVTSVNFGGPNLDELYVTTGRIGLFGEAPTSPEDGAIFRVTGLNAKGYAGVRIVL